MQFISKEEIQEINNSSKQLKPQYYEDVKDLQPLSPQVISRQATLNIGTVGHVAHGKSTVVRAISGVQPIRFRQQWVRNITIKLGYANAKIFKCPKCPAPDCYKSYSSKKGDDAKCDNLQGKDVCGQTMQLKRHISFCDCPGHEVFLSTMLTGAAVMDAALLLVAVNMECPQPQTVEHVLALQIMKLNKIIVLQNKIDILFKEESKVRENFKQIKNFMAGTVCEDCPIIPISAEQKYNMDAVCQAICNIPLPKRNLCLPPKMIIIRSFDVNKPGCCPDELKGGVVGGSILQGVLQVGMKVEIRPGHLYKSEGILKCEPIQSQIVSLMAEQNQLLYAVPGGLIAAGLLIDPSMTKENRMVGNILGCEGKLPDIYYQVEIQFFTMKELLGMGQGKNKVVRVSKEEILKFNVGSTETPGKVVSVYDDIMKVDLANPICTAKNQKVAFSRRIQKKHRLIGWGTILNGKKLTL